jgi:Tol biopolymer transport system component
MFSSSVVAGRARRVLPVLATLMGLVALVACGGGGGGEASTAPPPGPPPPPPPSASEGVLLAKPSSLSADGDAALVQFGSGAAAALPKSDESKRGTGFSDQWTASGAANANRELLRVDGLQNIEFFDRTTLARTGGFSVNSLPGVNQPQLWGPVKPSPDGRYVLAYWKQDFRQDKPALTVFDRNGTVIESGSKYVYDSSAQNSAFDWLPDGRYVYLAGTRIVLTTIGSPNLQVADLVLPANTGPEGTLAVSPDGQRLLMTLPTVLQDKSGLDVSFGLLFSSRLDGSSLTQLTSLTSRARLDGGRILHRRASWSPDGSKVAFALDAGGSYSIPWFSNGCPPVMVVPSDGNQIAIDGIADPASYHVLVNAPQAGSTLKACPPGPLFWLKPLS